MNATADATPLAALPQSVHREPTRGVRRAKSMDDAVDFGMAERRQETTAKKKKPPPLPRSNSFDDDSAKGRKAGRHRGIRLDAL
jgi:hypothetical protein